MKKFLSIAFSICMLFSIFAGLDFSASAITNYKRDYADGLDYLIDYETEEVTIMGGNESPDIVIPETIEGYPVTKIGMHAFNGYEQLRSIVIPDSVTQIGFYAFYNTPNLTDFTMSKNIERIEDSAFYDNGLVNNKNLWEGNALYIGNILVKVSTDIVGKFVVKEGTKVIAPCCFWDSSTGKGCSNMTAVSLPNTVETIGLFAFSHCSSLKSFDFPDSVKIIENCPFRNCINLKNITGSLPNIEYVGQGIFDYTGYFYDENNWEDGILYYSSIVTTAKKDITVANIKEGTTILSDYAFGCCFDIEELTLPSTLKYIGPMAFDDLHVLEEIEIPNGVLRIDNNAFDGCYALKELVIPNSVERIGLFAFNRTPALESITIMNPECVIIDNHEEETGGAYSVYSDTIIRGYKDSTANTFANNNGVAFESIGKYKLEGKCGSNVSYYLDILNKTLTFSGSGAMTYYYSSSNVPWLSEKDSIEKVIIEDGITSIATHAFQGCKQLNSIVIPESVTNIGERAFSGCEKITEFIVPNSIKHIGIAAFEDCSNLEKISLSENLEELSNSVFRNCTKLSEIEIPLSVKTYYGSCTYNTAIENIIVPSSVESIPGQFEYYSNLKTITILSYDCQIIMANTFPEGVTVSGYDASTAQSYCVIHNIPFNNLGCYHVFDYVSNNDATCTEDGTKTSLCLKCEEVSDTVVDEGSALGHDFVLYETEEATCKKTGYKKYKCSRCEEKNTEIIPQKDHNYINTITVPTCKDKGYTTHTCADCEDSYIDTYTDITENHNYIGSVVPATCEQKGYTFYQCAVCGDSYKSDYVEKTSDHDYGETITTPATCSSLGVKTFTCSVCGDSYTKSIPMIEHTPITDKAVAPTCEKSGLTEGSHCSVCGEVLTAQTVVNAKNHSYETAVTEPTCYSQGYTTYTCSECGSNYKDNYTAMAEHTEGETVKENEVLPTCTAKGYYNNVVYCTVCEKEISRDRVNFDKLAHTPETDAAVAPNCVKSGLTEGSHCSVCGEVLTAQAVINANGHSYNAVVTYPTCYSQGYTTYTCSVCGDSYRADYTNTTANHDYRSAVTAYPSCTSTGTKTYTCTVCGDKYTESIPMTEHYAVTDYAVPATFSSTGKTEGSHCANCGSVLVPQYEIAKLGAPSLSKVTAGKKQFKANWKAVAGVDGYEIRYATSSKALSKAKPVAVSGNNKTVKKLKAKKKYYVQIRAYKMLNGKKQYSTWSAKKTVTVK